MVTLKGYHMWHLFIIAGTSPIFLTTTDYCSFIPGAPSVPANGVDSPPSCLNSEENHPDVMFRPTATVSQIFCFYVLGS
jgi:hypothetical protein